MGLQDVAFLPCRGRLPTTLPKNCGRYESLTTITRPTTVIGGKQRHAPCKIPSLQQSLFLGKLNFMEIIRLSQS